MIRVSPKITVLLGAAVLLSGCGPSGQDDLRQWMTQLRATTKPRVTPLTEPKQFHPQAYVAEGAMEPFDPMKLTQALRRESSQSAANASLIAPEMARRKEPLEAFPLDSIKMVGSMNKEGMPTALVTVGKLLYQVRLGNYLGQNYGKIVGIAETGVQLREIVQDPSGDWMERMTTLELQEGTEVKK
jgi:type IV pilus assembly protein PilP